MIRSIDVMTIFHNKFTEIEANCTIDQQDKFIAYADIQGQRAVICLLEKSTVNVFV